MKKTPQVFPARAASRDPETVPVNGTGLSKNKQPIFFAGRRIAPRPPRARHFSARIAARVGR